jgi:hypothetical protein
MYFTFAFAWSRTFDFSVSFLIHTLLVIRSSSSFLLLLLLILFLLLPHFPPLFLPLFSSPPPPLFLLLFFSFPFFLLPLFILLFLLFLPFSFFFLLFFLNCPPLLSILPLQSPVPYACILRTFLNWLKPPQLRFSYTSSAFWFKSSKHSARIQYLHSTEVSQLLQFFCFCHFDSVQFIVELIKLIIVSCDPFTSENNYRAASINTSKCSV